MPVGKGWTDRARDTPPAAATAPVTAGAANTGILCDGLRVVDIDVDDPGIVAAIRDIAERMLGGTLMRSRGNSSRVAMLYRAEAGEPAKRAVVGAAGKVEILGRGQQLHVDGPHPSGAALEWTPRPPSQFPRDELQAVSEAQVEAFLHAVAPLIGATTMVGGSKVTRAVTTAPAPALALPGGGSCAVFSDRNLPDMRAVALRSIYTPTEMRAALASLPDGYPGHPLGTGDDWRRTIVFPVARYARRHPEHAEDMYRAFCEHTRRVADPVLVAAHPKGEAGYFDDAERRYDREVADNSGAREKIGPDYLIHAALGNNPDAVAAGWGGRWDGRTAAHLVTPQAVANSKITTGVNGSATAFGASAGAPPFFAPLRFDAAGLYPVRWLIPGVLIRGEVTVLAAQGGGAKTAFAVHLSVALASGRQRVGPFAIHADPGGARVAFMSGEEDPARFGLLTDAACNGLALSAPERAAVSNNLMMHDAGASGWRLGEPAHGARDALAPEAADRAFAELQSALAIHKPDLLILDTLAALFALSSEIDNNAITVLMRRLSRAARDAGCAALLLHHAPKMAREAAAGQRGEVTLIRGGSAIANSARVALTITSVPAAEAGAFAMQGIAPDRVRRLEHAKVNDVLPMPPAYFITKSEMVRVHDGSDHAVRAIEFIALPAATAGGGIPDAIRNLTMRAIDAGAVVNGVRVPLSPASGSRSAVDHVARAMRRASPQLSEVHAKAAARDVLADLRDRIGCIVEVDAQVPKSRADGTPNGFDRRKGLETRWHLAPWVASAPPAASGAPPAASGAPPAASGVP